MSVTARIAGVTVTISGYKWSGGDAILVRLLNVMLNPYGPSGADPYPDFTAAAQAVDEFNGEIIDAGERPEYVEGRLY